ncbi:unnamed protein product [Protopolystoma xenopodis]|uniref:Uncharacterized protein n=1 Tax=Protopolystoma xenopodis TaxID=117903 RepID=A0A3S5FBS3_9PLAT|nr:unnamed protein product [Protopolystoma xenopodis]
MCIPHHFLGDHASNQKLFLFDCNIHALYTPLHFAALTGNVFAAQRIINHHDLTRVALLILGLSDIPTVDDGAVATTNVPGEPARWPCEALEVGSSTGGDSVPRMTSVQAVHPAPPLFLAAQKGHTKLFELLLHTCIKARRVCLMSAKRVHDNAGSTTTVSASPSTTLYSSSTVAVSATHTSNVASSSTPQPHRLFQVHLPSQLPLPGWMTDSLGRTSLHLAAQAGRLDICRLLLQMPSTSCSSSKSSNLNVTAASPRHDVLNILEPMFGRRKEIESCLQHLRPLEVLINSRDEEEDEDEKDYKEQIDNLGTPIVKWRRWNRKGVDEDGIDAGAEEHNEANVYDDNENIELDEAYGNNETEEEEVEVAEPNLEKNGELETSFNEIGSGANLSACDAVYRWTPLHHAAAQVGLHFLSIDKPYSQICHSSFEILQSCLIFFIYSLFFSLLASL